MRILFAQFAEMNLNCLVTQASASMEVMTAPSFRAAATTHSTCIAYTNGRRIKRKANQTTKLSLIVPTVANLGENKLFNCEF